MRVISGKARRLQLKTPEGFETRPTTDRIKETLFNMINNCLYDCIFMDFFAGSGAIGIEALSRGAEKCFFVENNKNAAEIIASNLKFTGLSDNGIILEKDVIDAVNLLITKNITADIIFMDPPYNKELEKKVLLYIKDACVIDYNTLVIVEASIETDMSYVEQMGFYIEKEKKYKTNKHVFIKKKESVVSAIRV